MDNSCLRQTCTVIYSSIQIFGINTMCFSKTTLAFYFDSTSQTPSNPPTRQAFLQFQTLYHHPSGRVRLRVTTGKISILFSSVFSIKQVLIVDFHFSLFCFSTT
jgi:hypothetical protein